MDKSVSSRREFLLYWLGLFVVALSFISILLTISGLITNILGTQCYFPYVSPMLGIAEPKSVPVETFVNATMVNGTQPVLPDQSYPYPSPYPYPYCYGNPVAAVIQFVFQLLSSLIFTGVGAYMMLNGKKQ